MCNLPPGVHIPPGVRLPVLDTIYFGCWSKKGLKTDIVHLKYLNFKLALFIFYLLTPNTHCINLEFYFLAKLTSA